MVTFPTGVLGLVTRLGDDLRFAGVILGVEDFVLDTVASVEQVGELL